MAPLYGTVQKWKLRVNALPHTGDRKKKQSTCSISPKGVSVAQTAKELAGV